MRFLYKKQLFAYLIGLFWFVFSLVRAVKQPIDFDAAGYWWLAQIIHGVDVSNFDTSFVQILFNLRQMAYPIFLSPFSFFFKSETALRISVSVIQLLLYWLGVIVFSRSLSTLVDRKRSDLVGAVLLSLPFPYFLITELLQDSLTMSVAILSFGLAIFATSYKSFRYYTASLFAMGYAMSIRTDTQYVAVFVTLCGAYVFYILIGKATTIRRIFLGLIASVCSVITSCLFIFLLRIPNYLVTRHLTGMGRFHPSIDINAEKSLEIGLLYFKWTTGLDPLGGAIWSPIPWMTAADRELLRPLWHWYLENPISGLATVFAKFFALTDWDWPFTYYSVLPSHPNFFLSLINYVIVGNGLIGSILALKMFFHGEVDVEKRFLFFCAFIASVPYLLIHTLSHVEIRYGLPAIIGLSVAATLLITNLKFRRYIFWSQVVILLVWVPLSFLLSSWLRGFMPY
jgi:hypothetical protein